MAKKRSLLLKKTLLSQKGQGVMEYVILSTLIGVFCLMAVKQFGSVVQNRLKYMRQEIVRTIPTSWCAPMTLFRSCLNLMMLILLTHFSLQFLRDIRCKHLGWEMGAYKTMKFVVQEKSPLSGPHTLKDCSSLGLYHSGTNKKGKKKVDFQLFRETWSLTFSEVLGREQ